MEIAAALRRWRNSRGFGVHSPFGFMLVENVFKKQRGYAYYAYNDIFRDCRHDGSSRDIEHGAKTLMRLACILMPSSAFLPPKTPKAFRTALANANPHIRFATRAAKAAECDMIASRSTMISADALQKFLSQPGKTLLLRDIPEGWRDKLFDAMDEGLMFEGKHNIIIMSRPQMQKVRYLINI